MSRGPHAKNEMTIGIAYTYQFSFSVYEAGFPKNINLSKRHCHRDRNYNKVIFTLSNGDSRIQS